MLFQVLLFVCFSISKETSHRPETLLVLIHPNSLVLPGAPRAPVHVSYGDL